MLTIKDESHERMCFAGVGMGHKICLHHWSGVLPVFCIEQLAGVIKRDNGMGLFALSSCGWSD